MVPTRIFLADDHQLFLDGLHSLLDRIDTCVVVGEGQNGIDVLSALERTPADFVLIDIEMPELNGIETTKRIKKQFPTVARTSCEYETVWAGAEGYMVKIRARPDRYSIGL